MSPRPGMAEVPTQRSTTMAFNISFCANSVLMPTLTIICGIHDQSMHRLEVRQGNLLRRIIHRYLWTTVEGATFRNINTESRSESP